MPQGTIAAPLGTFDLNVGTIVDIEDIIVQLDPADVPLLGMNGDDGRFAIPRDTCFEVRKDWLDDTLLAPRCKVGATAILAGDTTITLGAADANRFPAGSVLLIDAEYIFVSSIDSTGTILTVTGGRGFGGTTAAGHATGADIVGTGMALAEGSQPGVARSVDRADRFNLTQIHGPHLVSVSGTELAVRKYGLGGTTEFAYQAGQRAKELYVGLEQTCYYGIQTNAPGVSPRSRTAGGFTFYVTANVDSATTTFAETPLLAQHQAAWTAGGNPRNMLMSATQKRKMANFYSTPDGAGGTIIRRAATDNERGEVVDRYISDFGILEAKMSRWMRTADLFAFDRDQLALVCLRPVQFEILAKVGDSVQGEIVGEYTFVVRRQKHCFRFSALT